MTTDEFEKYKKIYEDLKRQFENTVSKIITPTNDFSFDHSRKAAELAPTLMYLRQMLMDVRDEDEI